MHMFSARAPFLAAALVAAVAIAGCTAPSQPLPAAGAAPAPPPSTDPGAPAGGGTVLNAPPRVVAFQGSAARADNGGGSVEVFRATLGDDNAEADLASLVLVGEGPQRIELRRTLAAADLDRRADQSPGQDGWAVWDAVPHDGLLHVAAHVAYPYGAATGTYRWTLAVWDAAGERAASAEDLTEVEPVHVVEVAGAVTADGAPASAEGWGGWSAAPGARDVRSVTYLKIVNGGTAGGQRFLVDFTSREFAGSKDTSWRVPLDGNLRFGWWEANSEQVPAEGAFTWGEVSPDGSTTLAFSRAGAVIYVAYEVVQVPTPLPSQSYHASATVTAL